MEKLRALWRWLQPPKRPNKDGYVSCRVCGDMQAPPEDDICEDCWRMVY